MNKIYLFMSVCFINLLNGVIVQVPDEANFKAKLLNFHEYDDKRTKRERTALVEDLMQQESIKELTGKSMEVLKMCWIIKMAFEQSFKKTYKNIFGIENVFRDAIMGKLISDRGAWQELVDSGNVYVPGPRGSALASKRR